MEFGDGWPPAEALTTRRLVLEPLRVEHAEEMAPLLDDVSLHSFIGGRPATLEQLRVRYARQVIGHSVDGSQGWYNWVVRHRGGGSPVGTVQATVTLECEVASADVAWVIGANAQCHGYAKEAAAAMVVWLRRRGARTFSAYIHPDHVASIAVARSLGLRPTEVSVDGETRWRG